MAKGKKTFIKEIKYYCRDCTHSYDYHEIGAKGVPFLCRCPFFRFSKFLDHDNCEKFKLRKK